MLQNNLEVLQCCRVVPSERRVELKACCSPPLRCKAAALVPIAVNALPFPPLSAAAGMV